MREFEEGNLLEVDIEGIKFILADKDIVEMDVFYK